MDKTLADLFTAWWASGDRDAARVLADRLQELPAETLADSLQGFRQAATNAVVLVEPFRDIGERFANAFQRLAQTLQARMSLPEEPDAEQGR